MCVPPALRGSESRTEKPKAPHSTPLQPWDVSLPTREPTVYVLTSINSARMQLESKDESPAIRPRIEALELKRNTLCHDAKRFQAIFYLRHVYQLGEQGRKGLHFCLSEYLHVCMFTWSLNWPYLRELNSHGVPYLPNVHVKLKGRWLEFYQTYITLSLLSFVVQVKDAIFDNFA